MRLLLDTHVALWALTGDARLSEQARTLILDPRAEVFVSAASLWEVAIKHALGRGDMPVSAARVRQLFDKAGYSILPICAEHVLAVESLPAIHADPFDRIIVAQSRVEPLRLLTHDRTVSRYGDTVVFV